MNLLFIEGEYGFGLGAGSGFAFADTGQFFYGADRKLLRFNAIENSLLPCGIIDGNEGTCVAHADGFVPNGELHFCGELQQANVIGDGGAVLAQAYPEVFVREFALVDQSFERNGNFDGVQVFALNVLNQRHFEEGLVVDFADVSRHFFESGQLRCAKPPFAGDDLVLVGSNLVHRDGLDDAQFADALSELFQQVRVKFPSRLLGVVVDL